MRRLVILISILSLPLFGMEYSYQEMATSKYLEKQVVESLNEVISKEKYLLKVRANLKESASKQVVTLPLGGGVVEVPQGNNEKFQPEDSLEFLEKLDVQLTLPTYLGEKKSDLIKAKIENSLFMDSSRGDSINVTFSSDLNPTAFELMNDFKTEIMLFFACLGVGIIAARAARNISAALEKRSEESSEDFGSFKLSEPHADTSNLPVESNSKGNSDFWNYVDVKELEIFCYDCISSPLYESAAAVLSTKILDHKKASELEDVLPQKFFDSFGHAKAQAPREEVSALFERNRLEYKNWLKKAHAFPIEQLSYGHIQEFFHKSSALEKLALLGELPPIMRNSLSEKFQMEEKLKLLTFKEMNLEEELSSVIGDVGSKLMALAGMEENKPGESAYSQILGSILTPQTFEQDEKLFFEANKNGSSVDSILCALNWSDQYLKKFSLAEIAAVFSGYSESVHNKLQEKFSEKEKQWLQSFLMKAKRENYSFKDRTLVGIRNKMMEEGEKLEVSQPSNLKLVA